MCLRGEKFDEYPEFEPTIVQSHRPQPPAIWRDHFVGRSRQRRGGGGGGDGGGGGGGVGAGSCLDLPQSFDYTLGFALKMRKIRDDLSHIKLQVLAILCNVNQQKTRCFKLKF